MAEYKQREQELINHFVSAMRGAEDDELKIKCIHNCQCVGNQRFADVEYTAVSGQRWAIEAKYGAKRDKANEVHKLFGNLLRETGRCHRRNCKIGLLLPRRCGREAYFRKGVKRIPLGKFIGFGRLIPVEAVFVVSYEDSACASVHLKTWEEFRNGCEGRQVA